MPSLTQPTSLLRRLALLDYPLPLKLHAYLLLGLGVGLTFAPALIVSNPLFTASAKALGITPEVSGPPSSTSGSVSDSASATADAIKENPKGQPGKVAPGTKRNLSVTGLLALGLGLSYVGTAAFSEGPKENQLMYAAIPLRVVMSLTAATAWMVNKEHRTLFHATVIGEDMVGAVWLAWVMRDWPGWAALGL